ncbi:MAG: hypothetical protein AAF050_24635 [Cyanobacteria bacterium J06649_5]
MTSTLLSSAVAYLRTGQGPAPEPAEVVTALLAAEKQSKREKQHYQYEQLLGTWRLGFVSGTQMKRSRPNAKPIKTVGKGRFLPRLLTISIAYTATPEPAGMSEPVSAFGVESGAAFGSVTNSVTLGALNLRLQGPTRFWPNTNSLGFDFTQIQASLGPLKLYDGAMRGGTSKNEAFKTQTLKDQAFFTYFLVQAECIAARGKGGGLALWVRQ